MAVILVNHCICTPKYSRAGAKEKQPLNTKGQDNTADVFKDSFNWRIDLQYNEFFCGSCRNNILDK